MIVAGIIVVVVGCSTLPRLEDGFQALHRRCLVLAFVAPTSPVPLRLQVLEIMLLGESVAKRKCCQCLVRFSFRWLFNGCVPLDLRCKLGSHNDYES